MTTLVARSCSRFSLALAACVALAWLTTPARAQCGSWSEGLASPGDLRMYDILALDTGAGEQLHAVGNRVVAGGSLTSVKRWNGASWEHLFEGGFSAGGYRRLVAGIVAGTSCIFASDARASASGSPVTIVRWDGANLTDIGQINGTVECLEVLDDGSGPALWVGGSFTIVDGQPIQNVAKWNGATWTGFGIPPYPVSSLTLYDNGAGVPVIHAGTGTSFSSWAVMRFNGTLWERLGLLVDFNVCDMVTFDWGSGPRLAIATISGLRFWDGATWTTPPIPLARAYGLHVADLGAGPRLFVAGLFSVAGTGGTCKNIASFDGTTYTPLDGGIEYDGTQQRVMFADVPDGAGRKLHVRSALARVDPTPGVPGSGIATRSLAGWDGNAWSTLGAGLDATVRALAPWSPGGTEQVFVASSFAGLWNGTSWTSLGAPANNFLYAATNADLGAGPRIFLGGNFTTIPASPSVLEWNGATWSTLGSGINGEVLALLGHDDGAGPQLFAGGNFPIGGPTIAGNRVAAWNGTSWSNLGGGMDAVVTALARHDAGAGVQLFAGGAFTLAGGVAAQRTARWDGTSWSALGSGMANGAVHALCSFAGELWAGGTFTDAGGTPVSYLARWNGSAWSDVPGGGANGAVLALHVHDDGRGPALYAGGGFSAVGGISASNLARFDGAGWEPVDGGLDGAVFTLTSVDDDGDGDDELYVGGDFEQAFGVASGHFARLEGCPHYASFCFGDGSFADHTTPCPCGNDGAPGNGCAHSFGASGANLSASGSTFTDTVVLRSQFEPVSSFTLFLQQANQGDTVFHDGVLCAANPLVRLRGRAASGGEAFFPNSTFAQDTTTSLSIRGGVTIGSGVTRYYSAFYRNASTTFCPPATANVTNGVRVIW